MKDLLKRDFYLPEEDTEYLDATGLKWEAIKDIHGNWILIHDFSIPLGYQVSKAIAAIQISASYPMTQIDMVYFYPPLRRIDGIIIPATQATIKILGNDYQRWSRHRTQQNPWRSGLDNVSSHLSLVEEWLLREFNAS